MKKLIFVLLFSISSYALEGLKIGSSVPDISLKDIDGKTVDLTANNKKSIIVFYRGSWCPYCMTQLKGLQMDLLPKVGDRANLYAVSVDKPSTAKRMRDKFKIQFPVISDSKAKSLKAFNIINKLDEALVKKYKSSYRIDVEGDSGEKHHMVAHPAVFIISKGKIVFSDVHVNYKQRTENSKILAQIIKN